MSNPIDGTYFCGQPTNQLEDATVSRALKRLKRNYLRLKAEHDLEPEFLAKHELFDAQPACRDLLKPQ